MSEELKPCPFCGEKIKPPKSRQASTDRSEGFVAFAACYCGGYSATAHKMGRGNTEAEAIQEVIALWNHRAQPAEVEGVERYCFDQTGCAVADNEGPWVSYDDHLATLSAVTAERDQLRAKVDQLTRESEGIAERAKHYAGQLGKALGEMETLRKDAELYRRLRDLPDDQVGTAGVPCVAVPRGPFSGTYVSGAELDAAMAAKEA